MNATVSTLTINPGTGTEYAGTIAGTTGGIGNVAVVKTGAGTQVLSGANTFTGGLTIKAGTLTTKTSNAALGGGANAVTLGDTTGNSNASLLVTTTGLSHSQNITIANGSTGLKTIGLTGAATSATFTGTITNLDGTTALQLNPGAGANQLNLDGNISGAGALEKVNTGIVKLSGTNSYAGNTTITAGTLLVGHNNAIPNGAGKGNVTANGTLDVNGFNPTVNGLSGSGTVDNTAGGTALLTVGANDATSTFTGVIQNTGGALSLTKTGTGQVTLTGTNTYTGPTRITASGGTLELSGISGSITATTSVTLDGGTLLLTGGSERVNNSAAVILGGGTMAFDNSLANATETMDTLTLNANSSLDFGTAAQTVGNTFNFAGGFTSNGFTLNVYHWSGSVYGYPPEDDHGNPQDRLLLGGSVSDTDAALINFFDDSGLFVGTGKQIGFGTFPTEIVPVPEPSSTALIGAAGLLALVGYRERRRLRRAIRRDEDKAV